MNDQPKRCHFCGKVLEGGHTLFCPACWDYYRPLDNLPRCRACGRIMIGYREKFCPDCTGRMEEAYVQGVQNQR